MDSSENMVLISSLLDDDLSFWPLSTTQNEDGLKDTLASPIDHDVLLTQTGDNLETCDNVSVDDILDDPLPDWMSEKVSFPSWLEPLGITGQQLDLQSSLTTQDGISLAEEMFSCCEEAVLSPSSSLDESLVSTSVMTVSPAGSYCSDFSESSSHPSSPDSGFSGLLENEMKDVEVKDVEIKLSGENLMTIEYAELEQLVKLCRDSSEISVTPNSFLSLHYLGGKNIKIKKVPSVVFLKEEEVKPNIFKVTPKVKSVSKVNRKEKKRGQNKEAATRYRQKKKLEGESLFTEMDGLEKKNNELHEKVDSLTQEIKYLKTLMTEIYKVKGQIEVITSKN